MEKSQESAIVVFGGTGFMGLALLRNLRDNP
jgi:nucleoside-diphosphate-sugar epimerase